MKFYRLSQMITDQSSGPKQNPVGLILMRLCRTKSFGGVIETHFFSKNFFVSWISLETCPGVLHLQTVTAALDSVWKVKLQQLEKKNEKTKETARFSPV